MTEPANRDYLALRAEWLKARGHLEDPNTGWPIMAAVVEDLRRIIDDGGRLGVVYLDLASERILEEIYGWELYDGILAQAASAIGERIANLGPQVIAAQIGVRGDQFVVFVAFEESGVEAELDVLRTRLVDHLAGSIRVQAGRETPRGLNVHGASAFVRYDPTARVERSIYRAVESLKARCLHDREEMITKRTTELQRILSARDIAIRYQPIVWMSNGSVFGFEALSCGPDGKIFENPEMMFSFAERTDQILELERLCRIEAVRGATRLPVGRKLFLNCSAHAITDLEESPELLIALAEEIGLGAHNVVLEITERVAVTAWKEFRRCLDSLRELGFAIAIDDMGAGYSSLHSVAEVEPDFLKFDIALVRDIHESSIKRNLLESLLLLAQRIDAQVIAEGVEKEEEYDALREMRVPFGQGFLFSPPSGLSYHIPAPAGSTR